MRKFILFLALFCAVVSPAFAWDNTQVGGPNLIVDAPNSQGQQQTQSAHASASASSHASATATGGHATAQGGSVINNIRTSGGPGGWSAPPVASAYAPNVYGGPCTGPGSSLGGSTPMFGLSVGGNQTDVVCQLHMINQDNVAREFLCRANKDVREAAIAAGQPCAADRPAPVAVAAPVAFVPSPWCAKASAIERRHNPGSCGPQ